jgi:hypothetical protein
VVWGSNYTDLPAWVSMVARAAGNTRLEVVVVTPEEEPPAVAGSADPAGRLRNLRVTHVFSPAPSRVMRRAGLAASTGDVVLLTEPGEQHFEFRLSALLRQLEARWGNLSLADPADSEPHG